MVFGSRNVLGFAFALCLAVVCSVYEPVNAQSAWPPPPTQAGDDPYIAGTFTSNGHHYKITFVDVVNTLADPNDHSIIPGPALATLSSNIGSHFFPPATPTYTSSRYSAATNPYGTDMGAASHLWRIASVVNSVGAKGFVQTPPYTGNFSGMGNPVFRYIITCSDPPSNNFGVNIRIANGVSSIDAWVDAGTAPLGVNSGTANGLYPLAGLLSAAASSPNLVDSPLSNYRAIDMFEPATLINGVGWFGTNLPVHVYGTLSINATTGISHMQAAATSSWEIVPVQVIGP